MPRSFKRRVDVPEIDLLDWILIRELTDLFRAYEDPQSGRLGIEASDSRGTYEDSDLQAFRKEVETQPEEPHRIMVYVFGKARGGERVHFQAWWEESTYNSGAVFTGEDEAAVVYAAERTTDALRRAADRREKRIADAQEIEKRIADAQEIAPVRVQSNQPPAASGFARFFYNPWVVGVGTTVIAAAVVAVIVALMH